MKIARQIALFFAFIAGVVLVSVPLNAEQTKICLTMIVKNESAIIERCLDSVKGIVDCISICDTGSTDGTVKIIEQYMAKNGIPGKVYTHEWKNFGHNRTLSAEAARKTLEKLGFALENSYLLLIDADMILEITPEFSKSLLKHDSCLVVQKTSDVSYYNTRLVRASLPWKCIGVTHEYWGCGQPCTEIKLETLSIDDRNDGGSKADKFERDIRLLTQGLKEEPENERYMFYLAQSYKCLNQFEEAISWYKKRIEKGGWKEEVWYSRYMIGECYETMNKWDLALTYYLQAYEFNPERAETLHQISKYYRMHQQHELAYVFAKQGSSVPYPSEQTLFISHPIYHYLLDEEISIAAYYTSHKQEGFAATNRLLLKKNIPQYVRDKAYDNLIFYVEDLKNAEYKPIKINLPSVRQGLGACYNPMNPSIQKTKEGYNVICRTVNYTQIGAKHFQSMDLFDSTIRTKNFFLTYDKAFNLLSQHEIVENLPRETQNSNVQGLEDCRMFSLKNSVWFTCTTWDRHPNCMPQISLCKLSDQRSGSTVSVEKLIPLQGPDKSRVEKNWLPFVKDGEFHFIYSYSPLTICKPVINGKSPGCWSAPFKTIVHNYDFSRFSGSAAPVDFDDGYLCLVHEIIYGEQRVYTHRLIYLDRNFVVTKVSKPFIFLHKGIEYCCGMTIDHTDKKLIMSIGIEDREANLCIVDLEAVRSMLEPLDKP